MNDKLRDMVMENRSTDDLQAEAEAGGMISLRAFGMNLAADGVTTLDEVIRETVQD